MHSYQEALKRLFSSENNPKLGLDRMGQLLFHLGNPHLDLQAFHIAGTNGKGSTCAYLESMLRHGGYRTGLYTSPHLVCARERIQMQGKPIEEDEFIELEHTIHQASQHLKDPPSFFERITAMAFLAFQKNQVDYAVFEVGLGGRLDATNLLKPLSCGITQIGLDHTLILGKTVGAIAKEKAGIIKPHIPVVSDQQPQEAMEAIIQTAKQKQAPLYRIGREILFTQKESQICVQLKGQNILPASKPNLFGKHQLHNASLAVAMLEAAQVRLNTVDKQAGIESVSWPVRYETVCHHPLVILDGAHNPDGLRALLNGLQQDQRLQDRSCILLIGMTQGHDASQMIEQLCLQNWKAVMTTQSPSHRALPAKDVQKAFLDKGIQSVCVEEWKRAAEQATYQAANMGVPLVVTGSLYLAGAVRSLFIPMPMDPEMPLY